MQKLTLAVLLLENGIKLYYATFIAMFPFLLAYGGVKWALAVSGLDDFPVSFIESTMSEQILLWGFTIIHTLVYFFFFAVATIIAYQEHNAVKINIMSVIKKAVNRYATLLLGSLIGGLLIFYPAYMIELIDRLRTGNINVVHIAIFIVVLSIIVFNFVLPVGIANKNLNIIQGFRFSGRLVVKHWVTTFAVVVFWGALIMFANWLIEEFDKPHSKAIISLVTFSLIPCLMVVLCDNFEKAALKT